MADNQPQHAEFVADYVYGWGRTKHIKNPFTKYPKGLCGASGGNSYAERQRGQRMPVCQHCLRYAARIKERTDES